MARCRTVQYSESSTGPEGTRTVCDLIQPAETLFWPRPNTDLYADAHAAVLLFAMAVACQTSQIFVGRHAPFAIYSPAHIPRRGI